MEQLIKEYVDSQVTWNPLTRYVAKKNLIKMSRRLTREQLTGEQVYIKLKQQDLGMYTIKQYMILLSRFEKEKLGTTSIEEFLNKRAYAFRNAYNTKTKLLTKEVYEEMLARAPSKFIYNTLLLMGKAGLRRTEAYKAEWTHFENDTKLVVKGKGGKIREIPFNKASLKPHGFKEIGGHVSKEMVYRYVAKFGFSPHDLRAYFATTTANLPGLNLNDVANVLGHSNVTTTQRYVRTDYDKISKALIGE